MGVFLLQEWVTFYLSLFSTAVKWLESVQVFGVPLVAVFVGLFVMGVILRALLYKA